jgi:hypothetical protein
MVTPKNLSKCHSTPSTPTPFVTRVWASITPTVSRRPLLWYGYYLAFEYWILSIIPYHILTDSAVARTYVKAISALSPVIHRFDKVAQYPEVISFFLAISVLLMIPKIVFAIGWLRSDKLRIYRYLVISPLTNAVPKKPLDFVTDPLLDNKEIVAESHMSPVSLRRRILVSIAALLLVFSFAIFMPWCWFGATSLPGPMEQQAYQGGWRLWLAWSVYLMTMSSGFFAIGYCILVEYFKWFKDWIKG